MFVIGEVFSFIAAACLAYSTFSKSKNKMMHWQTADAIFNGFSNLFLLSFSGFITNILTAYRNYLTGKEKCKKIDMIIISVFIIIFGIIFNNRGLIGLFPIIASIQYTISIYKRNTVNGLRIGLVINLILWGIYDFTIKSYPMFIMDIIIIILSIYNGIKYRNKE